jgi:hypothetical protein
MMAGWWFGTCFIFPYIGNFIIPTDFHIVQRGRYTTNQMRFIGISGDFMGFRSQISESEQTMVYGCIWPSLLVWSCPDVLMAVRHVRMRWKVLLRRWESFGLAGFKPQQEIGPFIDGLPINSMVIFQLAMLNNQMVF